LNLNLAIGYPDLKLFIVPFIPSVCQDSTFKWAMTTSLHAIHCLPILILYSLHYFNIVE